MDEVGSMGGIEVESFDRIGLEGFVSTSRNLVYSMVFSTSAA